MWIIENGVRMWPGCPFYYLLLLEPEMDSNLTCTGPPLSLDVLAGLLRRWPRRSTSKGFLGEFSISLGRAPTWARVPRINNKPMTTM